MRSYVLTGTDQWRIVLLTLLFCLSMLMVPAVCRCVHRALLHYFYLHYITWNVMSHFFRLHVGHMSTSKHLQWFWYLLMKKWTFKSYVSVYLLVFTYYIDFSHKLIETLLLSSFYARKTLSMTVSSLFLNEGSNILQNR